MAKVSIIMPSFNRGWILSRAIKSVLTQTYTDYELIVINDASTDNTEEVLSNFTDSKIIKIKLDTNGGLSHARNTGLKSATGEFIAYLDSDNLWYPDYLKISLESFDEKTKMVYSGQNLLYVGGSVTEPKVLGYKTRNEEYNPAKLVKGNFIDVNCVVHKKSILGEIGFFDENLKVLEDWDLFAQIAIKYPFGIKHIDQVLSEYYFYKPDTAQTLTNQKWQDWVDDFFGAGKIEGDELTVTQKLQKLLADPKT